MKKIVYYSISIILLFGYLYVLFLSIHPHVPLEYRAYYMDKDVDYYISNDTFLYSIGEEILPHGAKKEDVRWFANGWDRPTDDGIWTLGNHARLLFSHLPNKDLTIHIVFNDSKLSDDETISLYYNDVLKKTYTKAELSSSMRIDEAISKDDIVDSGLKVSLKFQNCENKLGLLCWSVCIDENS